MLALEQLAIPNSHSFQLDPSLPTPALYKSIPTEAQVEFDAELMDLERRAGSSSGHARSASGALDSLDLGPAQSSGRQKAFALTVGLVIHSLADGLALGVSSLAKTEVGSIASNISIVVFLALLLHKGEYFTLRSRSSPSCFMKLGKPKAGLLPLIHFGLVVLHVHLSLHTCLEKL
jgi:zinc transporter 9